MFKERNELMTRLLKALGLAMSAMAMFAVLASSAHAATGALTAAQYPAFITGEQGLGATFDFGPGPMRTVTCATSDLNATIPGPADPVTFTPVYAGCTSEPGGFPATVTTNGCDYSLGVSKPMTTGIENPTTGRMQAWLNCPAGAQLEIHVYQNAAMHGANVSTCTYDVGPQGPVPGGIYHNIPGAVPTDVVATVNATFNGLSTIGPAFICGGNAFENIPVTLTGNYTLRGYQDFGFVEGAQQPIVID
jgi:hypothetical protein